MRQKSKGSAVGGKTAPSHQKRRGRATIGWALVVGALLVPALIVDPASGESFRLPKLVASEVLVLLSLIVLSWRVRSVPRVDWRWLAEQPVVRIAIVVLLAASVGLFTSLHPAHVRRALSELAVGLVALVGWALLLDRRELERVLFLLMVPASVLALVALGQNAGLVELFELEGTQPGRLELTSLAGGVFDLSAYLVLPCLMAQVFIRENKGRWARLWATSSLGLGIVAIALSQTIGSIIAVVVGSLVIWARAGLARLAFASAGLAVACVALVAGIGPLRHRLTLKVSALLEGDFDRFLTGRLDGWNAATWMIRKEPLTGVGHGAYRAEFGEARLDLWSSGTDFYWRQHRPFFANAHSDVLEALAEWGLVGAIALAIAVAILVMVVRRRGISNPQDAGLVFGGLAAILVLSSVSFPWHVAIIVYPWILFLAWILSPERKEEADER